MKKLLILAFIVSAFPVYADDWKTTDGKTYENVKVIKVEDDAVTILYKEGGALVPLSKLPPAVQKKYSYDPVKAKAAADLRASANAENEKKLQTEKVQAEKLKQKELVKDADQHSHAEAAINQTSPPPKTP